MFSLIFLSIILLLRQIYWSITLFSLTLRMYRRLFVFDNQLNIFVLISLYYE